MCQQTIGITDGMHDGFLRDRAISLGTAPGFVVTEFRQFCEAKRTISGYHFVQALYF